MSVQKLLLLPSKRIAENHKTEPRGDFHSNHSAEVIYLLDYINKRNKTSPELSKNQITIKTSRSSDLAMRLIGMAVGMVMICGVAALVHFIT